MRDPVNPAQPSPAHTNALIQAYLSSSMPYWDCILPFKGGRRISLCGGGSSQGPYGRVPSKIENYSDLAHFFRKGSKFNFF